MILNDFQRGRIPYFFCPPFDNEGEESKNNSESKKNVVKQDFNKIPTTNEFQFIETDNVDPSKVFVKPSSSSSKKKHSRSNSLSFPLSTEESLTTSEEIVDWDEVYKVI